MHIKKRITHTQNPAAMHYQTYQCLDCGHNQIIWTWYPKWLYEIDFLYNVFINKDSCEQCISSGHGKH